MLFPISWREPFGMVLLEAMASGTPVLATNWGAVSEIVRDGVTGFVRNTTVELGPLIGRIGDIDRAACRNHVAEHFSSAALVGGGHQLSAGVLAEQGTVQADRRDEQHRSGGGQGDRRQVHVMLGGRKLGEPLLEGQGEQKPRQQLHAGLGHAQSLQQVSPIGVQAFGR